MSKSTSKRQSIIGVENPIDPFIPITKDNGAVSDEFIAEMQKLCEEFGTMTGEEEITHTKKSVKKGYNPLSKECGVCQLSLLCSTVARVYDLPEKGKLVKKGLGHTWYYDESRVKELSLTYVEKLKGIIRNYHSKGKSVNKEKLLKLIDNYCTSVEGLRSSDPQMPLLIYERVLKDLNGEVSESEVDGVIKLIKT